MRKTFGFCLALLFLLPSYVFAETIDVIEGEVSVAEIEEKIYCNATIADDFEEGVVIVTLKKSATKINSTVDVSLFSSCVETSEISSVTNLTRITNQDALEWIDQENYHQVLKVEISQKGKAAVLATIKKLEKNSDVLAAQPNYIYKRELPAEGNTFDVQQNSQKGVSSRNISVNDPYHSSYHLNQQMGLSSAWEMTKGSSTVLVGVMDSGIDSTHEDLQGKLKTSMGGSFIGDGISAWSDPIGHGTHVAGIIGSVANNGKGSAGICWDVQMVSLRVYKPRYSNGSIVGDETSSAALVNAIAYAKNQKIPILNLSFNCAFDTAVNGKLAEYTGLIVCAAGNEGVNVDVSPVYPACLSYSNIISVAASLTDDSGLWSDSNYGVTSVDVAAPGSNITSTFPSAKCNNSSCGQGHTSSGYHRFSGTSIATPHVTGVAALLLSYYPAATTQTLKNAILNNVSTRSYLSGKVASGGVVNARKALESLSDYQKNVTGKFVCGDFNGDGKDDSAAIADYGSSRMQIRVSLFNGSTAEKGQVWFDSPSFDATKVKGRITAGDFNGDGKDDIAMMCDYSASVANKSTIFVFLSNGTSFGTWPETWFTTTSFNARDVTNRFAAGDFNGDGKDDIAAMYDYSSVTPNKITMFIFKSTGYSFGGWPETWYTTTGFNANMVTNRFVAGDFNGDGKDDVAGLYDYSAQTANKSTWFVFKSTGTAFSGWPQTWFTSTSFNATKTTGTVAAGDFTGDGKDDIVTMYNQDTPSARKAEVYVFSSSGSSFGTWPTLWITEQLFNSWRVSGQFASGDINNDGKCDVVTLYDYTNDAADLFRKIVFRSNGTRFYSSVYP